MERVAEHNKKQEASHNQRCEDKTRSDGEPLGLVTVKGKGCRFCCQDSAGEVHFKKSCGEMTKLSVESADKCKEAAKTPEKAEKAEAEAEKEEEEAPVAAPCEGTCQLTKTILALRSEKAIANDKKCTIS